MSRKITILAINSFQQRNNFSSSNTAVKTVDGITKLYLHGNLIAKLDEQNKLYITNAGWQSVTTKERLNGFLM